MDNRPIGVMDSGVGGLTVLKEITKILPNESYIFIGDQANLPYGQKRSETVRKLTKRIADYMVEQNVKMFVIACNTATAAAYEYLKAILPIPVIGVIEPGSQMAAKASKSGQIGVIATNGTVRSGDYERLIKRANQAAVVSSLGCPEFVTMVEEGLAGTVEAQVAVNNRLAWFMDKPIDTLVMGCTHFPILEKEIQNVMGDSVTLIDPGVATARQVRDNLSVHDTFAVDHQTGSRQFYTTGNPDDFAKVADKLLGTPITAVKLDI